MTSLAGVAGNLGFRGFNTTLTEAYCPTAFQVINVLKGGPFGTAPSDIFVRSGQSTAKVVAGDIAACNAVVHLIDTALQPCCSSLYEIVGQFSIVQVSGWHPALLLALLGQCSSCSGRAGCRPCSLPSDPSCPMDKGWLQASAQQARAPASHLPARCWSPAAHLLRPTPQITPSYFDGYKPQAPPKNDDGSNRRLFEEQLLDMLLVGVPSCWHGYGAPCWTGCWGRGCPKLQGSSTQHAGRWAGMLRCPPRAAHGWLLQLMTKRNATRSILWPAPSAWDGVKLADLAPGLNLTNIDTRVRAMKILALYMLSYSEAGGAGLHC
jgi:hypothetical protein